MKRALILTIFFLFGNIASSQNNLSEIEKLATTAKVWGFLKYYHPQVADGKYDWDQQLLEILPKVKKVVNKEEFSELMIIWIESLGKVKPCNKCSSNVRSDYFDKNFDLSWILDNRIFTKNLSDTLHFIEQNRHQGKKHYVNYYKGKPKAIYIDNEIDYSGFDWNNKHLRLLSLFRYWNIVEYFFPAKYQTNIDWDDVLLKMIPKYLNVESETDFHLAMVELAVSLNDGHVRLDTRKTYDYFGHYYLPVKFEITENVAVVTGLVNDSLAQLNDLRIGDAILKANGKSVEQLFQEREKYIPGSNQARKRFNANFFVLNGSIDSLEIQLKRKDGILNKTVKRYLYKDMRSSKNREDTTKGYRIIDKNIGYINLAELQDVDSNEIMEELKDTKAIIFDQRQKSSKSVSIYDFVNYITSPRKSFYKALIPDLDYPSRYIWDDFQEVGHAKELKYEGEVVLLVDSGCQSQCEFEVMCLQSANNTTTIGTTTSGANGNIMRFNMVGGFITQISGVGIFYPDGTEAQRNGVKIDIVVNPTIEGIAEERDEILERAIEFLNK